MCKCVYVQTFLLFSSGYFRLDSLKYICSFGILNKIYCSLLAFSAHVICTISNHLSSKYGQNVRRFTKVTPKSCLCDPGTNLVYCTAYAVSIFGSIFVRAARSRSAAVHSCLHSFLYRHPSWSSHSCRIRIKIDVVFVCPVSTPVTRSTPC